MARTKISEFSATPANNTDIDSINIAEGCAPSGINDAIRELMAQLKDFQTGAVGDSFNGPIGSSTASTGAFTNITASGTLGVTGVATLGAGAILNTPASVTLTNATGLPISTGVSGLGTGVATALAVNTGSAGAPVLFNGALGTPSSGTVTNLTGTASININGTVGATTPTTGAFTTLAASSTVTLSGGTANGVAYLNGSKVVTSGSALVFDGTTLTVGTGTNQLQAKQKTILFYNTGVSDGLIQSADDSSTVTSIALNKTDVKFYSSGSEQMRLTSTGLGIGTSSPASKLTVSRGGSAGVVSNFTDGLAQGLALTTGTGYFGFYNPNYGAITFRDGGNTVENMRLTDSGNLGLGVTPSAWSGVGKTLQINTGGAISADTANTYFSTNSYYNGTNWIYQTTNNATRYTMASNSHLWYVAPSGTAGNAITFTQAMTLDASGNLLVGATSSTTGNVNGTIAFGGADAGIIYLERQTGTDQLRFYVGGNRLGYLNTASSAVTLGTANYPLVFATNDTERARIDSSGNLLVGTTSLPVSNGTLSVKNTAGGNNIAARFFGDYSDSQHAVYFDKASTTNTTSQVFVGFTVNNQATGSGQINANGASQAAFGSFSDSRLKENIVDLQPQLSNIMALRPVEFDYIESEGGGHQTGFIAQEMETIFPDAVGERSDGMKTITGWNKTEAILVKALQEAVAKINSLEARLDAANL